MDLNWRKKHVNDVKQKAGPRYNSSRNVELPISAIFDGLSRTKKFYFSVREKHGKLLKELQYLSLDFKRVELQKCCNLFKQKKNNLSKNLNTIKTYNAKSIPWDEITNQIHTFQESLDNLIAQFEEEKKLVKDELEPLHPNGSHRRKLSEKYDSYINDLRRIYRITHELRELSQSSKARLSNNPFLLLSGSAGNGKTHLLCDLVDNRLASASSTSGIAFMLFGENFNETSDVWSQIISQLNLSEKINNKDELLTELNSLGSNAKSRSLLIIDALNETNHREFWKNNLGQVVNEIKKYPHIGFIISVRSGFESEVLTDDLQEFFTKEIHTGFAEMEWEAVNKFFKKYNLPLQEIPLMEREFQNPLFLLMFCERFEKGKKIFRGREGLTDIFEQFVKAVSRKLEKELSIDHGPRQNIWNTVIKKLAEAIAKRMINDSIDRISESDLVRIITTSHPNISNPRALIQSLEKKLLIAKVPDYKDGKQTDEFNIRFSFQKFSDHLICRYIFNDFRKFKADQSSSLTLPQVARKFFRKSNKIGKFLSKSWNRGIIEALSIQCPEQLKGIEFVQVVPYLRSKKAQLYFHQIIDESFLESLVWRKPDAFEKSKKQIINIINRNILPSGRGDDVFNAFLSVSPVANHPFNAEFLHKHLSRIPLPRRDAQWSVFLHNQNGQHNAVDRMLKWALSEYDKSSISDEQIFLASISIAWFLTTPNREVRDKATKGLINLLTNRMHLICNLLEKFHELKNKFSDPYIMERLYAVAYGCTLRNQNDIDGLKKLSEWIYNKIFKRGNPPAHVLLRDYARGVIEVAIKKIPDLRFNIQRINPPYKSKWPKNIPTTEELKRKYYPEKYDGFSFIWFSVMGGGDFDRYIIGTNSHSCAWSGRNIRFPEVNRKKILENFEKELSKTQLDLLKKCTGLDFLLKHLTLLDPNKQLTKSEIKDKELSVKVLKRACLEQFKKTLSSKKRTFFTKEIEPFLDDNGRVIDHLEQFNLDIAKRYIFNQVVKLGYSSKLHTDFDHKLERFYNQGRDSRKPERIGKKYQWIAYHKFIALLSDNFQFKGWRRENKDQYLGPWDPGIRDIDISLAPQKDQELIKNLPSFSKWQKTNASHNFRKRKLSHDKWLNKTEDLPNPKNFICFIDDKKEEWVLLDGFVNWEEDTSPELERYETPRRELWYMPKSYIIKKTDHSRIFSWAINADFSGRWMPEAHKFYQVFLGEYPNSVAFNDFRKDVNPWIKIDKAECSMTAPMIVTSDIYLNEFTLDCSLTETSASIMLPCKWLVNQMSLSHPFMDGRFFDNNNNLVAFTNTFFEKTRPVYGVFFNKKFLVNFLKKNEYSIFWTAIGEKQILGGRYLNPRSDNFATRLEITGAYTFDENQELIGQYKTKPVK